jgi:hypothetical protein
MRDSLYYACAHVPISIRYFKNKLIILVLNEQDFLKHSAAEMMFYYSVS